MGSMITDQRNPSQKAEPQNFLFEVLSECTQVVQWLRAREPLG